MEAFAISVVHLSKLISEEDSAANGITNTVFQKQG